MCSRGSQTKFQKISATPRGRIWALLVLPPSLAPYPQYLLASKHRRFPPTLGELIHKAAPFIADRFGRKFGAGIGNILIAVGALIQGQSLPNARERGDLD